MEKVLYASLLVIMFLLGHDYAIIRAKLILMSKVKSKTNNKCDKEIMKHLIKWSFTYGPDAVNKSFKHCSNLFVSPKEEDKKEGESK